MSERSDRGPAVRRARRWPAVVYWVLGGGVGFVALLVWFFVYITSDRLIPYLGREPITAAINRVSSAIDLSGYCEIEVWRLSEESRAALKARGSAILAQPHRFKPGFQPAEWRALERIDAGALPWNPRKCEPSTRAEFLAYAQSGDGFAAAMRREDEEGRVDVALFLLALDGGFFARAVFSGEAVGRLDAGGVAGSR